MPRGRRFVARRRHRAVEFDNFGFDFGLTSGQFQILPRRSAVARPRAGGAIYMTSAAESRPAPAPAHAPAESSGGLSSLFASTNDSRSESVFGRMKTSVGRLFGSDDG